MLFIINADGTVQTTFPSQVYQGSNAASDIIVVAPWVSGAAITVSFELPNGARTTPSLMTPQESPVTLDGVEYRAWRALLPYAITQYAGTVTAQFSIYTDTQTVTSSAATFEVYEGAVPILPDEPSADVYEQILAVLSALDTNVESLKNTKLDKVTDSGTLAAYAANAFGGQTMVSIKAEPNINTIAYRTEYGAVKTSAPQEADDATPMQYVNDKSAQTLADAKAYANERDEATLEEAKRQAIINDAQTLSNASSYTDTKSTQTLNAAKTYADEKDTQTLSEAKAYTDTRFSQFDLVVVVSELPATGEENKLYLLTKENGEAGDLFEEYLWVKGAECAEGAWELQGSASIDLSQYATVAQLDGKVSKANGVAGKIVVYAVDSNNNQITANATTSWAEPDSIARRTENGALVVSSGTNTAHAVNLGQMQSYVETSAISSTTTGTIEPVAGSRVMTLGSNGNVILIEGNPSSYRLVGVKSNGDPVMYKPNNYSAESQTVAVRGTGGVLVVGTPTAANHATTKQYVDEKCVTYTISTDTGYWYDAPVSGPPDQQDARAVLLSDIGVNITGAKGFMWTLHNEGSEGESGCSALVPCTPTYNGGKVQIDTEELYILGSQTIYRFLNLIVFY